MTNTPKGGRGKKAPYRTKTIRIPVELEPLVEKLISDYRDKVMGGASTKSMEGEGNHG